jgi:3-hydroxyisobutyrate dehydrogenase-like beta-hydroxyacid dehydrogenase
MKIGIIGCGIIGSRMGQNWQKAGHTVIGWNRTSANAQDAGFPLVDSPETLARTSDIIMIVVADPAALVSVTEGPHGLARTSLKGKVVLNASTVGPADNLRATLAVQDAGGEFLETPFTGSKDGAAAGKLVFYVGGDRSLLARMEPLLLQIGQKFFYFGKIGTAADAKLIMNMMLANLMQAMAEGLSFAGKAGLDTATFLDAYKANAGYSVLADMKLGKMLIGDYSTHFSLKHMDKDIRLALERAAVLGTPCPLTERLKEIFSKGMAGGLGEQDFSSIYKLVSSTVPPGTHPVPPAA